MRIKKIVIKDLFGLYDYTLDFSIDNKDNLTIIHALNGTGKTTLLLLIKAVLEMNIEYLNSVPFWLLTIYFDNGKRISVGREDKQVAMYRNNSGLPFYNSSLGDLEKESLFYTIDGVHYSIIDEESSLLYRRYPVSKKANTKRSGWAMFSDENNSQSALIEENEEAYNALRYYRENCHVYLIKANRLVKKDLESQQTISSVEYYKNQIKEKIVEVGKQFGDESERLDQSFPRRVLDTVCHKDYGEELLSLDNPALTEKSIFNDLFELEEKRKRLRKLGLHEKSAFEESLHFSGDSDLSIDTRVFLRTYIDDSRKKLRVYDELADKLEALKTIINERNQFSDKKLNFDAENGMFFTSTKGVPIPIDKLSSGEMNSIVLFYELIFECKEDSILLVDEPEISMHVSWQRMFLDELTIINKQKNLQTVVATHSPDIVSNYFDCMIDLENTKK